MCDFQQVFFWGGGFWYGNQRGKLKNMFNISYKIPMELVYFRIHGWLILYAKRVGRYTIDGSY